MRRSLPLVLLGSLLMTVGACVQDLQEAPPDDWDPQRWRAEVLAHMASVEPLLPRLRQASRAGDTPKAREFLRSVQAVLERAEHSLPALPWRAGMAENVVLQRYSASLREMRHGAATVLAGLLQSADRRVEEGQQFIGRGISGFQAAQAAARGEPDAADTLLRDPPTPPLDVRDETEP